MKPTPPCAPRTNWLQKAFRRLDVKQPLSCRLTQMAVIELEKRVAVLEGRAAAEPPHIKLGPGQSKERADEMERRRKEMFKKMVKGVNVNTPVPPVDRTQRVLLDGKPITHENMKTKENGQQASYIVLTEEERARGFMRPVRDTYRHTKCGTTTTMSMPIAETYARDPGFYGATFCCACGVHLPVGEFTWTGTTDKVGS